MSFEISSGFLSLPPSREAQFQFSLRQSKMALHHSFSGKRVLVTGGAGGIGRQLVQRFHDDGAIVFTVDKNAKAVEELKKALPKVKAEVLDLGDWDATKKMVESFGVIDHLVNNAAVIIPQSTLDITKEDAQTQFNVILMATLNVSQVVAKRLIAEGRGGSIVNIASIGARLTAPELGTNFYCALKAGVENLTKSMAVDLGKHNIRVNAVSPGTVDTGILGSIDGSDELKQTLQARIDKCVFPRMITTNEIADLVLFLLSPLSTMIIGESVLIDGGFSTQ